MKENILHPYSSENIQPGFSVDCVILTFHDGEIKVLLAKRNVMFEYWVLPGGFMFKDEDADKAAWRALKLHTGLTDVYMKQFHLFSDPSRTSLQQNRKILTDKNVEIDDVNIWFIQRFVSLGYYALINHEKAAEQLAEIGDNLQWFSIKDLPKILYSDHENIINTAIETIKLLLPAIPLAYELLPKKFTMLELRKIYEILLDKTFDRRNFQRKILMSGNVLQLDERKGDSKYNPAILYSFDEKVSKNITSISHI